MSSQTELAYVQSLGPQSPWGVGHSEDYFSHGMCELPEIN